MTVLLDAEWRENSTGSTEVYRLAGIKANTMYAETERMEFARAAGDGDEESDVLGRFARWLRRGDVICVFSRKERDVLTGAWKRVFGRYPPFPLVFAEAKVMNIIKSTIPGVGALADRWNIYDISDELKLARGEVLRYPMNDAVLLMRLLRTVGISVNRLIKESAKEEYYGGRAERNYAALLRTGYKYVYSAGSEVFHTPDCHCILRSDRVEGCEYYFDAAADRRPCAICRPYPDREDEERRLLSDRAERKPAVCIDITEKINVKLVSGERVTIGRGKLVGRCHYKLHPGRLTKALMDEHDCIGKECAFFERYKYAPYWVERAKRKEQAKEKKRIKKEQEAERLRREEAMEWMCDEARRIAGATAPDMYIVRINQTAEEYEIFYVSDNRFADGNRFPDFLREMKERSIGKRITLRHIRHVDGHFVTRSEYFAIRH